MSIQIIEDDYYCPGFVHFQYYTVGWIGIRSNVDSAEFVEYFKNSLQKRQIEIISYHVHSTLDDDPYTRCIEIKYKLV